MLSAGIPQKIQKHLQYKKLFLSKAQSKAELVKKNSKTQKGRFLSFLKWKQIKKQPDQILSVCKFPILKYFYIDKFLVSGSLIVYHKHLCFNPWTSTQS